MLLLWSVKRQPALVAVFQHTADSTKEVEPSRHLHGACCGAACHNKGLKKHSTDTSVQSQ